MLASVVKGQGEFSGGWFGLSSYAGETDHFEVWQLMSYRLISIERHFDTVEEVIHTPIEPRWCAAQSLPTNLFKNCMTYNLWLNSMSKVVPTFVLHYTWRLTYSAIFDPLFLQSNSTHQHKTRGPTQNCFKPGWPTFFPVEENCSYNEPSLVLESVQRFGNLLMNRFVTVGPSKQYFCFIHLFTDLQWTRLLVVMLTLTWSQVMFFPCEPMMECGRSHHQRQSCAR